MMALAFIIIVIFMIQKSSKPNMIITEPTSIPVSESTKSDDVQLELDQTFVESPSQELMQLEAELEAL